MTSNQINYYKAQEDVRSHKAQEAIGWASHFVDVYNAHTQRRKALLDYSVNRLNAQTNIENAKTNARNAATNERQADIAYQNALINLMNAQTRVKEADIAQYNAETSRYNADIRLMELDEVVRHNIENEQLGFMQNQLGYAQLAESTRHNTAQEYISQSTLEESITHNTAMEAIQRSEANTKQAQYLWNVEYQQSQLEQESKRIVETTRHNVQSENIGVLQAFIKPVFSLIGAAVGIK